MEKFFWNVAGGLLVIANLACLILFLFSHPWMLALAVILALDYIYIDKRPEWTEV